MLKTRLNLVLWGSDLIATRFFIATASLIWGFLLFWPGETFGRPTYDMMAKFASEPVWAILFTLHGVLSLYALLYNIKSKSLLVFDGVLGCLLWTGSCVAMLLSVYPPPAAISAEIVTAFASWWVLVRYPEGLK